MCGARFQRDAAVPERRSLECGSDPVEDDVNPPVHGLAIRRCNVSYLLSEEIRRWYKVPSRNSSSEQVRFEERHGDFHLYLNRWRRRTEELSGLLQDDAPIGCPSRSVFSWGRADKQPVITNERQMPLPTNQKHTRKKKHLHIMWHLSYTKSRRRRRRPVSNSLVPLLSKHTDQPRGACPHW